jgi:hypothetical protein
MLLSLSFSLLRFDVNALVIFLCQGAIFGADAKNHTASPSSTVGPVSVLPTLPVSFPSSKATVVVVVVIRGLGS